MYEVDVAYNQTCKIGGKWKKKDFHTECPHLLCNVFVRECHIHTCDSLMERWGCAESSNTKYVYTL